MSSYGNKLHFMTLISVAGGIAVCYFIFKSWRSKKRRGNAAESHQGRSTVSRQAWREVMVPRRAVGLLIGKRGVNIKKLQEVTKTRICCLDEKSTESFRAVKIRGLDADVELAYRHVMQIVAGVPEKVKAAVCVRQRDVGSVIGRGGGRIKEIREFSGCEIDVGGIDDPHRDTPRNIVLTGAPEQLKLCKYLVSLLLRDADLYNGLVERLNARLDELDIEEYDVTGPESFLASFIPSEKRRIVRRMCIVESIGRDEIDEVEIEVEVEEVWDVEGEQ